MANPSAPSASLEQLRDIHLPEPIGLWPLAPGWYLLIFLLVLCLYFSYKWYQRQWIKRAALRLLKHYEQEYHKEKNGQCIALKISMLMKRVALLYFPRENIAGLEGEAWIDFLHASSKKIDFQEVKTLLIDLPYQKNEETNALDLQALFIKTKAWIKQRRAHV